MSAWLERDGHDAYCAGDALSYPRVVIRSAIFVDDCLEMLTESFLLYGCGSGTLELNGQVHLGGT